MDRMAQELAEVRDGAEKETGGQQGARLTSREEGQYLSMEPPPPAGGEGWSSRTSDAPPGSVDGGSLADPEEVLKDDEGGMAPRTRSRVVYDRVLSNVMSRFSGTTRRNKFQTLRSCCGSYTCWAPTNTFGKLSALGGTAATCRFRLGEREGTYFV